MTRPGNSARRCATDAAPAGTWQFRAIAALLVLTFVTGGGSYDRGYGDVLAQLLALPVLGWSLWSIAQQPQGRRVAWPLAIAAFVFIVVAIQGLPMPGGLSGNPARAALLADIATAGADTTQPHWSLTPWASQRGLWSLLPALALFAGALLLDAAQRRRMVLLVVGLVLASLVLGYVQLGAPQDSPLNPFPEWAPALNGVFANQNHQATAIGVALVLLLALFLQPADARSGQAPAPRGMRLAMALAGVLLIASLPLAGSRAMALLAVLALLAVPLINGTAMHRLRATRLPRAAVWAGSLAAAVIVAAVVWASLQWAQVDANEEVRGAVAQATAAMGRELAPWGAGLGSFVPWFDQHAPDPLVIHAYFNHAHNEYAQWWLESGVAGMAALAAALALLAWSYPANRRGKADAVATGSWVAVMLVLAHSAVDYPLRTPSMMAVTALLGGIAIAAALKRAPRPAIRTISRIRPANRPS